MSDNNLIPFSKELWERGEYELEQKDIVHVQEIFHGTVYFRTRKYVGDDWKGDYTSTPEIYDTLMLRKKTKKVWIPLQEKFVFETKEACERYFSRLLEPTKAIEVEI